jgi:hypothetical protein
MVVGTLTNAEAVSVRILVRRTLLRFVGAAAATAVLTGAAFAQFPMPSVNLEQEKHRTPEQIEHDKAIDQAYQSATKKIPDKQAGTDPWADVRSAPAAPAAPPKKKQQLSQDKKHTD